MTLARVFPRKTNASPTDALAFFGTPPVPFPRGVTEAHVSVAFTYDKPLAEYLADVWSCFVPTKIGGPAYGDVGGEFTPGRYLAPGYTITSRGCPNRCWFCDVWKREGRVREYAIKDGWNLLDSNILACSPGHITRVFAMLARQTEAVELTGGLEAKRLTAEHVDALWYLRPKQMFFAYDTPDDYEPLVAAGELLRYADFSRNFLRCFVLIGWPKDTMARAERRLLQAWKAGFLPMAMLWRGKDGETPEDWRAFQRGWARPAATRAIMRGTTAKRFYSI
jgi:hypothetical protein